MLNNRKNTDINVGDMVSFNHAILDGDYVYHKDGNTEGAISVATKGSGNNGARFQGQKQVIKLMFDDLIKVNGGSYYTRNMILKEGIDYD